MTHGRTGFYIAPKVNDTKRTSVRKAYYTLGSSSSSSTNREQRFYVPSSSIEAERNHTKSSVKKHSRDKFDPSDLRKLHLQLKHGSHTAMREWIRAGGLWEDELDECIENLLHDSTCKIAKVPNPHPIVSKRLPITTKQTHVAVDVIFFEGVPCLHVVCRCTGWSETTMLRNRQLSEQTAAFLRIQSYRHGTPKVLYSDGEYFKGAFKEMCDAHGIEMRPSAAEDHEVNGVIESANAALRIFFNRVRSGSKLMQLHDVLAEATYG